MMGLRSAAGGSGGGMGTDTASVADGGLEGGTSFAVVWVIVEIGY